LIDSTQTTIDSTKTTIIKYDIQSSSLPNLIFISCDTLAATDMAATLLGWVHPILPMIMMMMKPMTTMMMNR
jgi:hypothetical protein